MAFSRLKALLVTGLLALWATQAAAIQPDSDSSVFDIPLPATAILQAPLDMPGALDADDLMTARYGGDWYVHLWQPVSRTPLAIYGSGVQVSASPLATDALAEQAAMNFFQANGDVLRADASDLRVDQVARGAERVGVQCQQYFHGIPVIGGRVKSLFTEEGRLVLCGSSFYSDVDVSPVPALSAAEAEGRARADLPFDPATDKVLGETELFVLPVALPEGGADYHLVWRTRVALSAPYGVWVTHVDAHNGEIVWRYNDVHNAYSGSASGPADQPTYCQGQQTVPFRNMYVNVTGIGTATTDATGNFSIAGSGGDRAVSAQFNGPKFNVNDTQYGDATFNGTIQENVPLAISWSDATPSRRAERDAFYWLNQTYEYVRTIDPVWTIPTHLTNVNVNSTCNANWTTWTMNFFREGGGCANTAHIGDVMAHEFGHGIQYTLIGSQGQEGCGEGNGDIAATFMANDHVMARGFYLNSCSSGLRDCLNTLRYPGDVVGQQIHNAGRVICGFNWDLRVLLENKMGTEAGKAHTARLWHFSRKVYFADTQPEQVLGYFAIDDNDGNLGNGTPNRVEICQAATNHGFSCPAITEGVNITHTPLDDTTFQGPFTISATIAAFGPHPLNTSSARLWYSVNGGAFASVVMTNTAGSTFEAQIPAQSAGTAIAYYIVAETTVGVPGYAPPNAPDDYYLFGIGTFNVNIDDNIETDLGWTVTEPGTDGTWERVDPNGTFAGSVPVNPENDHTADPGVICWVTGNPPPGSFFFTKEVDGRTSVVSPLIDLAGASLARGSVWLWAYFPNNNIDDHLDLSASADGGTTWTLLRRLTAANLNAWNEYQFVLSPLDFTFTSQMRFKVTAEDIAPDTVVDCGMDDFFVRSLVPDAAAVPGPADVRPVSYVLHPSQPNPFNPRTEIRYELPADGPVSITVYDVTGREVRVLVNETKQAGMHSASWDGTDSQGQSLASGVYFYRLEAAGFTQTRRMALVK
jgi:Zn-dependent metalloprotease